MWFLFTRKPREPEKHPAETWHDMREKQWENFIKSCGEFDYVKIKDGRAVGYMLCELPELQKKPEGEDGLFRIDFSQGSVILIPFEVVRMTYV